jgi:hypothetical protein
MDADERSMDRDGRLLPAIERYWSAASGKGFRLIADYVHGKGLTFEVHIALRIPRQDAPGLSPGRGPDLRKAIDKCVCANGALRPSLTAEVPPHGAGLYRLFRK